MSLASLAEDLANELREGENAKAEGTAVELLASLRSWLDQRRSSSQASIAGRVRVLLADGTRRTASEIAKELHVPRKEVNSMLYALSEFQKSDDSKPVWGIA